MRTIKISFLSTLLCLISHVCFAQAYKYECKQIDENFYICQLNESYKDELILLKLGCKYNTTTVFGFWGVPFLKYGGLEKGSVLKLFLSNGEILTGKRQNDTSNSLSFILGAQEFYSSKVSITDNDKRANYIMRQLRKYNIIKFSVNGKITSTPNFRSAATIDAMCKTLISKTGDQGQYGSINTSSKSPATSSSTNTTPVYQKNWKTMSFNGSSIHRTMSPTKTGYLSHRSMIDLNDVAKVENCKTAILKCVLISHNGTNTNIESEITLGWSDDRKMLIAVGSLTGGYVGFMAEKYNVKADDYLYDAGHRYRFTSSVNNVSVVYVTERSTYLRSEHYIYIGNLNNPNKEDVYYIKSVSFPAAGIYNCYPCYDDDEGNLLRLFVTEVMYKRF